LQVRLAFDISCAISSNDRLRRAILSRVGVPHAKFHKKRSRRPHILDALRGIPPGGSHLAYWRFVDGPIRSFGRWSLFWRRAQVGLARGIGLLHVRESRNL
jgi:hypothetical protein